MRFEYSDYFAPGFRSRISFPIQILTLAISGRNAKLKQDQRLEAIYSLWLSRALSKYVRQCLLYLGRRQAVLIREIDWLWQSDVSCTFTHSTNNLQPQFHFLSPAIITLELSSIRADGNQHITTLYKNTRATDQTEMETSGVRSDICLYPLSFSSSTCLAFYPCRLTFLQRVLTILSTQILGRNISSQGFEWYVYFFYGSAWLNSKL